MTEVVATQHLYAMRADWELKRPWYVFRRNNCGFYGRLFIDPPPRGGPDWFYTEWDDLCDAVEARQLEGRIDATA